MPVKPRKPVSVYSAGNQVALVKGGADFFTRLLQLIADARHSLHLQTYIYDEDETGNMVADALLQAAGRGVKVFVLVDGYASKKLSKPFLSQLKAAGIQFRRFQPFFRSRYFYFGRRLHHKITVADARVSLTGGINISNRYNDMPGHPAWMDWALYAEGEVGAELYYVCLEYWNRSGWGKKRHQVLEAGTEPHPVPGQCLVRIRQNDWVKRKIQITRSYLEMCRKAQTHIVIMSSYFLPGRIIRRALAAAAKRGVQIRVIAAARSDLWITKYAERYLYHWLFRNGIQLYEYQPNVLHSKLSAYDGKWVTVGSYNVNNISAYASVELNIDVLNDAFAQTVEERLRLIMQEECRLVTAEDFEKHNRWYKRLWQWICYQFIRHVFNLFTFYFKQRG